MIGNGVSALATKWFADDQIAMATTIGSLANPLGVILGMGLGSVWVHDSDRDHPKLGK